MGRDSDHPSVKTVEPNPCFFKSFTENAPIETNVDWPEFVTMAGSSIGIGLLGFGFAFLTYYKCSISRVSLANWSPQLYEFSKNKWYLDELYYTVFVKPTKKIGGKGKNGGWDAI